MNPIKLSSEIEQYIQESDKNRNYSKTIPDNIQKGNEEQKFFISKFPRSEIRKIKMLDYVPGKTVNGNPDRETFSYLTEFGSTNFGKVGGGSAKKFVVYIAKKTQEPVYPPKFASADEAFDSLINLIADCVDHAENFTKTKDWKKFSEIITQIAESQPDTPSIPILSKIIAMYYPDEFLRIWSHSWLNKILDLFQVGRDDLPETGKEGSFYEKMQRVVEAKNSHPIMKEWSNKYFSYTIGEYIKPEKSENRESPLLKFLKSEMRMKSNYQPIVIKMLLESNSNKISSDEIKTDEEYLDFLIQTIEKTSKQNKWTLIKNKSKFLQIAKDDNTFRIVIYEASSKRKDTLGAYVGVSDSAIKFLNEVKPENRFLLIINHAVKNFVLLPYSIEQKYARFVSSSESSPNPKKWDVTGKRNHAFRITIDKNSSSMKTNDNVDGFVLDCTKYLGTLDQIGLFMTSEPKFSVSLNSIRKKFDELNFGRMSYVKASGRPGGNDAISSVAGALKKFVKFPEGTSQGNATLKDDVVKNEEIPECLKICGQSIARWHIDNIAEDDFEIYGVLPGRKEDDYVYLDDFIKSNRIGTGWNNLGDLSKYSTKKDALSYIKNDHPTIIGQSATHLRFDIKPKDIVVVSKGQKEIIDFGIVTGDYHYRTDESGEKFAAHTRSVVWLKRGNIKKENFPNKSMMEGIVSTVNLIDKYEQEMINLLLEEEGSETGNYYVITQNDGSRYMDIEGMQYGYDSDKSYSKNFQEGTKFVVQSKIGNKHYFIGYGKVGKLEKTYETKKNGGSLTKIIAKFSNYTKFEENKIRTQEMNQKLLKIAYPNTPTGGNTRSPPMLLIPKKIYEEITGDRSTMSSKQETISEEKLNPYIQALEWKPNLILYGPPGTGKTFFADQIAKSIALNQVTEKKIPKLKSQTWLGVAAKILLKNNGTAIDYHDFSNFLPEFRHTSAKTPEETISRDIRQEINTNPDSIFTNPVEGKYGLKLPTTFVKAAELVLFANNKAMSAREIIEIIIEKDLVQTSGETPERTLSTEFHRDRSKGEDSTFVKIDSASYILRKNIERLDEVEIKQQYRKTVTFHQTFSYEEFMEGIKAKPTEDGAGVVYYVEDGIFKKFCEIAEDDPKNKYIMIIDEINRGNISKIFGELITVIEKDKREDKKITLAYSKDEFSVPKNVLIIGTMNTADQSLTHLDAALKRRFTMMEIYPDPGVLRNHKVEGKINLTELLVAINRKLVDNKFRDGQIGHAYFMSGKNPLSKISELQMVFAYDIIPLLREYFYDDESKMKSIFGEGNWQSWFDEKSGDINKKWQDSDGEKNFVDNIKKSFGV